MINYVLMILICVKANFILRNIQMLKFHWAELVTAASGVDVSFLCLNGLHQKDVHRVMQQDKEHRSHHMAMAV